MGMSSYDLKVACCLLCVCYRTESVIEKLLSHWLSLCMYDHLRHQAPGKALYTLYQAIKCQTEKGAVDAITGEARYSLNESRLLRENITAKQMVTVRTSLVHLFYSAEEIVVVMVVVLLVVFVYFTRAVEWPSHPEIRDS